ncbi:hypothetical protein D3C86_1805980 [compost metagenome]
MVPLELTILIIPACSTTNNLESPAWAISIGLVNPVAKGTIPIVCEKARLENSSTSNCKVVFISIAIRLGSKFIK